MSEHVFDVFARRAATAASRRGIARALAGLAVGGLWGLTLGVEGSEARKKGKKKRKKKCKGNKRKCGKKCIAKSDCCNDSDCGNGASCVDKACVCPTGQYDCQGTCIPETQCCTASECNPGQICVEGQCVTGQGTCQAGDDVCLDITSECGGGDCYCWTSMSNETRCGLKMGLTDCNTCASDDECAALFPGIPGVFCIQDTGEVCACGGSCFAPCQS